jgi:hypothetical protein
LDFGREELCPEIWAGSLLREDVRNFIYQQTIQFFERRGITRYQGFIEDCYIASSLAAYTYRDDTDFDIKFVINIPSFKKYNPAFNEKTYEEITDYLIDLARESTELTAFVPNTEHELDPYFYDELEGVEENLIKYDSLYSVGSNAWIKEPRRLPKDIEPDYFINKAKLYAEPYLEKVSKDIEKTKQDSMDFILLKDYLHQLDDATVEEARFYYAEQMRVIDEDLDTLVEDRELIKKLRANNFSRDSLKTELEQLGGSLNYGKGNLIFKLFQRYGYMRILNEIKDLVEKRDFTIDDLPVLMTIINN